MHITDPIADMLTRIRNANSAKHSTVDVPASNMKKAIAKIPVSYTHLDVYKRQPVGRPGPVTPWGKPALGYKTRKKKNRTDKFIVRRRNAR